MNVGWAVRLCRTGRGLTQSALAKKANLSAATVSLIESGERDASLTTLRNLAIALGVPLEILVFLASDQRELSGLSDDVRKILSEAAMSVLNERPTPTLL